MKSNKRIIQAAVLNYVTEIEKIRMRSKYLLENKFIIKKGAKKLFENYKDIILAEELILENIKDKIKGFFSKKDSHRFTPEEIDAVKTLRQKIETGFKKVKELSKISIEDPTKLGMNLEKMIEIVEEVKRAADYFEKVFQEADRYTQEELEKVIPELMKAKMSLFGLVAFIVTEIKQEATNTLRKLLSYVPSEQLAYALNLARRSYTPEVPLHSAGEMVKDFFSLSGGGGRGGRTPVAIGGGY
jgi:hypothetical protein